MTPFVEALLLAGYAALAALLTWRLFPPWGTSGQTLAARTCLAFGITVGLASAGLFTGMLALSSFMWGSGHGIREFCEALVLITMLITVSTALPAPTRGSLHAPEAARCPAILRVAVVAIVIVTGIGFVATTWGEPHGGYDAIAMWNMRARALAFQDHATAQWWSDAFEPFVCRPNLDYPLLVGAWNARLMLITGVDVAAPIATAAAFLIAVAALCGASAGAAGGAWRGCLAIVVVFGWDTVADVGAKQMADVQVAFYILAATVCLRRGLGDDARPGLLVLAGMAMGGAAWTKNEGLLYGIAVALASGLLLVRRGFAAWSRAAGPLALGALPFAGALALFKAVVAPANDIVAVSRQDEILAHLANPQRYVGAITGLVRETVQMGKGLVLIFIAMIVITRLLGGTPARDTTGTGHRFAATALALTLGFYLVPYVITRHDQAAHIGNSMFRLLLQLWPAAVFLGVLSVGAPEPRASGSR